jgi:Protein of unknown function (DUF3551)
MRPDGGKDDAHSAGGAALTAFLIFDVGPVRAVEGPWCAFISLGTGNVYEDCQYYALETCVPNVLAGNRGFCNVNPRWVGPQPRMRVGRRACLY